MPYLGITPASTGSVNTANMADSAVSTAKIAANAVTGAKFNADVISSQTALGVAPADTDEFLVSDGGVIKRIDYSLIKGTDFVGFEAFASANQVVGNNTDVQVAFGGEYYDVGSNFASSTFTAPSAGKYLFYSKLYIAGLGDTTAQSVFLHTVAGGSSYGSSVTRNGGLDTSSRDGTVVNIDTFDMTANSTVHVRVYIFGDRTIGGNSTGTSSSTRFGGYKIG